MSPDDSRGALRTDRTSPGEALAEVLDAGERIVEARFELALLRLQEVLARGFTGAMAVRIGVAFCLLGWSGIAAAATLLLSSRLPLPEALFWVGAVHVLIGAVLLGVVADRVRRLPESTRTRGREPLERG